MRVFPAVDILGGKCVQLVQGKRENSTAYGSPLECARRWTDEGADSLHIVNLDGAFGDSGKNAEQIKSVIDETGAFVQLGGGIRSLSDAAGWLNAGVDRVIIGTLAIKEPECIRELSAEYGSDRVVAGVDARDGQVVVSGWEEPAGDYIGWAKRFEELGAGALLFTNVDVEGLQEGIAADPVRRLLESTYLPVIIAGGISLPSDVVTLKKMGVDGIVMGSALYSGKISLKEALEVCR
ncbi:1-(5-phosphoribosyl)-5-[(5-phosphoribosylamino)methylideneamino]imidazole-4-carboxamide isomerase [Methanoplanus sp. FWC-SCC4]|uniref:1-(5-phosphoribosyl)-5-[(5-phosphoribosylamino)methylideneamino] imidazole-4-carboxamide isomerase n=1 Tax=Methanochimaera problematica TaxID=2609417 RepID=A0AA97FC24_9EURY|nr:1-(5-phosphoribosyl)-5-[(5-phosphoribosylamino)methylideneamino]imidazole-4-carboxamide isomerase [Methanoplanus sp. FWC-SCC4]WOF15469.1 1-(5-phosphoribosyl)-5-[(5-phosphoribosylamino)methylideneamino]imidazole-4-carboxamide isomerase [Methanoplanus sp. FWC-SCC4]